MQAAMIRTAVNRTVTFAIAAMLFGMLAGTAHAQYKPKSRPFDSVGRRPSVSPYMQLLNNQTGTATNYQSLVRPQIEQWNFNSQSSAAIKGLQRSQAASSGRSKSSAEGNLKMRATGHAAARESYSHFYPGLGR